MKQKIVALLLSLLMIAVSSFTGIAAEAFNVVYDVKTHTVCVSGSADKPVSIIIYKIGSTLSADMDTSAIYYLLQLDIHTTTNILETIPLSRTVTDEYVSVEISCGGTTVLSKQLELVTNDRIDRIMLAVNEELQKSTPDLIGVLNTVEDEGSENTNGDYLHFDSDVLNSAKGAYAAENLAAYRKGQKFQTSSEFISLMEQYYLRYDLKSVMDEDGFTLFLSQNGTTLGIDAAKYYTPLSSAAKVKLLELLNATVDPHRTFAEEFQRDSALAIVQTADRWSVVRDLLSDDDYKTTLGFEVASSNLNAVAKKMMDYPYNDFSDIEKNYKLAKTAAGSKPADNSGNTSSKPAGSTGVIASGTQTPVEKPKPSLKTYTDLSSAHWAHPYVTDIALQNVFSGYPDNTFRPDNSVTRAEFAKIAVCAFGLKGNGNIAFDDIAADSWAKQYVDAAASMQIILGDEQNCFHPDLVITREDAAVILARCLRRSAKAENAFVDDSDISDYARESVYTLKSLGIITGRGNHVFEPKESLTRAETAVLISKCLEVLKGGN